MWNRWITSIGEFVLFVLFVEEREQAEEGYRQEYEGMELYG
jgi:hypothetical protein